MCLCDLTYLGHGDGVEVLELLSREYLFIFLGAANTHFVGLCCYNPVVSTTRGSFHHDLLFIQ